VAGSGLLVRFFPLFYRQPGDDLTTRGNVAVHANYNVSCRPGADDAGQQVVNSSLFALVMSVDKQDWFEQCLDRYPDLPSVVLIRSAELKHFPRKFLRNPILDLCCGDGFFTSCLGLQGVYGCDRDEQAVEQARIFKETYAHVAKCDARDLKIFDDAEFNSVFSNCALEHVDGIDDALTSIARVLKKGGHLVMSVPDYTINTWFFPKVVFTTIGLSKYGSRLCEEYNRKQEHINIYPLDVWKHKLEGRGLSIEKHFYLFSRRQYALVTFFESFVLDSFPGNFFRKVYSAFKNGVPLDSRKRLWRRILKRIYQESEQVRCGGELVIVACKKK
jgi:ubiquinone/menaquinone biosynthesis C-methylase UbiE